ncbi:MAG TPA: glutamyl-tRNA reductase [Lachnospiraceae bacterium]|nr:glutamyl-tRNA reductase [Lachnospiraceae bacterium]
MSICMIGIDHNRAAVDIRAVFSFTKKNAAAAMEAFKNTEGISGCVILSTCNRMECWISTEQDWEGSLCELLCGVKGVDPAQYSTYFVERRDKEAVDHLFYLTCGLKSQILGEDQILTQVKDALSLARENFSTDSVLEVLFRMAVTAGKKVKTDVSFSRANYTAMDSAVAMLTERGTDLKSMSCLVIGNGEMGKLAAQALRAQGADVTVTVRQYRSGIVNIPVGCKRIDYGDRIEMLPYCDIVVSATASPNYTITRELMEKAVWKKGAVFIDLAVPRDIEPGVRELAGLELYDIDDFKGSGMTENYQESLQEAETVLQEQIREFYDWLEGRDLIPKIRDIQEKAVEDLNLRIHKILTHLPLEDTARADLQKSIDTAAGKVVGKMIYGLRDTMEKEIFLECVEGMGRVYER